MYPLIEKTSNYDDPFDNLFSLFFPSDTFQNWKNDFSKVGFKKVISRPHDIVPIKDKDGNIIGQTLTLVYTPFKKNQIKVNIKNDMLTVSIGDETKEDKKNEAGEYYYRGISHQTTKFSLRLSEKVNKAGVVANADEGILTITIPFVSERKEPETIEVKID